MGDFIPELDFNKLSYLTYVKKEINGLHITNGYKAALIKCVEKIFDSDQLPENIYVDEFNRKLISAERDLVSTRLYAKEDDVLFACPHQIEDNILRIYRAYISRKFK